MAGHFSKEVTRRKKMKRTTLWLAMFALVAFTASAFAQVGRIEGDVVKRGTTEGIPGAEVVIERTDIKGSYPVKTDKKGHYLHAGVPYVGTYTIMVSAPGFAPAFVGGIKPGGVPPEGIKLEMDPGDGSKLTMDMIKRGGGGAAPAPGAKQPTAAEIKKQQEEYEKAKAANEKNKADFENMKKFFDSGMAKQTAKDYVGAIADFNEAVKLDAEQKAIWGNLALALYNKGVTSYNESIKGDASKKDVAKQDFTDAISATDKALALVEKDMADPTKAPAAKKEKTVYLKIKGDSGNLLATKLMVAEQSEPAFKAYTDAAGLAETPAEKISFQVKAANVYREAFKNEEAAAAYKAIIEADPDNIEAYYGLGLVYSATEPTWQESANNFQKFIDRAPATDGRVVEAKTVIAALMQGNKNLVVPKADTKARQQPAKKKG
jgi:tetratricopeptide (TPR) repeat protein